ncbi:hypothetical protein EOD10_32795, partial [Mesorhizobium sp. M7A.T.Ca.TU.009.01.3.2]
AGILSPYRDGERGAVITGFANLQRCKTGDEVTASPFSPSLYGESRRGPRSGRKANCLAFRTTNARQGDEGQRRPQQLGGLPMTIDQAIASPFHDPVSTICFSSGAGLNTSLPVR